MLAAGVPNRSSKIKRVALVLSIILICLQNISCSLPADSGINSGIRIKNFGRINENYYRGGQPEAVDFADLKKLGIKTVINLRNDASGKEPDRVKTAGMTYFQIPLTGSRPATAEQTEYFLSIVNDPDNWPVFVHCAAGRHRTGEMTAIYRITHDSWTADQAYIEMKKYGFYSFPNHGSLKDYVYRYYRNYSTAR